MLWGEKPNLLTCTLYSFGLLNGIVVILSDARDYSSPGSYVSLHKCFPFQNLSSYSLSLPFYVFLSAFFPLLVFNLTGNK